MKKSNPLLRIALTKKRTKTQLFRIRKCKDPLVKWILMKIYVHRENCIIKIIGKVQKGKSTIAQELAWRLLPWLFHVGFIVFHPDKFSEVYNYGVKRGDPIIYEEIGTEAGGLAKRRWYDFNNMLILDIMQTHGFEGTICILTLPSSKYLDSNAEPLIDIEIEAMKIDRRHKVNVFRAYWCEWSEKEQKLYKHCFLDDDRIRVEVFRWKRTIPKELIKAYKKKEREFKRWIQKRVNEQVKKKQITEEDEDNFFKDMMSRIKEFMVVRNQRYHVSVPLIETEFRVGHRIARRLRLRAEKEILSNPDFSPLRGSLSSKLIINVQEKTEGK